MISQGKKWTKTSRFPNVFVLVFVLACIAALLTWFVPAGQYEHQLHDGVSTVIPKTYHQATANPQGPLDLLRAFVQGFRVQISLIMFVFVLGAATHILAINGCFNAVLGAWASRRQGQEKRVIFFMMLLMSMAGAFGILGNVIPVLVPVGIFLSYALGYDKTLGFFIIYLGAFSGFNAGWSNVGILGTAQNIAGLPFHQGIGLRLLIHAGNFLINYLFVCLYLKQLKRDPQKSLNYQAGLNKSDYMARCNEFEQMHGHPLWKHKTAIAISLLTMLMVLFGTQQLGWGMDEKAAVFLGLCILFCVLYGYKANETALVILEGAKTAFNAAFIIGFSACVVVILREGRILDTLTNILTAYIHDMSAVSGANAMLSSNILFSVFVTSGSAHANNILPVMIPIADNLGLSRDIAVQAFLFGDGLTNCIVPTIGALMSSLIFADISYWKYLKKVWPLFLIKLILSFAIINLMLVL